MALIAAFLLVWAAVFSIANAVMISAGLNLIAVLIATAIAALSLRLVDPWLKARWPSGRSMQVDATGIRLMKNDRTEVEIHASEPAMILRWRFRVSRRGRVPKGWYVVACALEQEGLYLPVYALASPEQVNLTTALSTFTELVSEKAAKGKQDSLRASGEQRRLRLAEMHRWNGGAEMSFDDFTQFVMRLDGQYPLWDQ